jgi:hypothetical protein
VRTLGLGLGLSRGRQKITVFTGTAAMRVRGLRAAASGTLTMSGTAAMRVGGLRSSGSGTFFSPVSSVSTSCSCWLRADLGTGVAGTWADQSGNGHNITQATGSKQPTVHSSGGANNQAYLAFAKANSQFMQGTWTLNQNWELFVVAQWGSVTTGSTLIDGASGNAARIYINNSTGPDVAFNASPGTNYLHETTVSITSWQRYNAQWAGTSGAASVAATACTQGAGTGIGTTNAGGLTVGAFGSGASAFADVNVAEVIAYGGILSSGDRANVVSYLQSRYGLT